MRFQRVVRDRWVAYRRDPRMLDQLRDVVARMEIVARRSDRAGMRKCDLQFHHELCLASGNDFVLKLWEALSRHIATVRGGRR
jgi:DNA-binding GntR family transcriptional regulator